MFNISTYLEKFKGFGLEQVQVKEIVVQILKDKIGVEIENKNITIRAGVVYLQADPIVKNQVYIKKTALLEEISQKTKKIKDIK